MSSRPARTALSSGRVAALVEGLRLRPGAEQCLDGRGRAAERGNRERRRAVGCLGIGVRAALEQRLHQGRRIAPGRHGDVRPAEIQVLLPGAGALHGGGRTGGDFSAAMQRRGALFPQSRRHVLRSADLGKVQRRPVLLVTGRHIRTGREQSFNDRTAPAHGAVHQHAVAAVIGGVHVGMGLQQRFNRLDLARARREHERRDAELIGRLDRCATRNEQLDNGTGAGLRGAGERTAAKFVRGGDGGSVREHQGAHCIAGAGRQPQRFALEDRIGDGGRRQQAQGGGRVPRGRALPGPAR